MLLKENTSVLKMNQNLLHTRERVSQGGTL